MKLILFCFLIIITIPIIGSGNQNSDNQAVSELNFIRSTGNMGKLIPFRVFIDEILACKLNDNKYSVHQLSSGSHSIAVQFKGDKIKTKTKRISIDIESGKTYYYYIDINQGPFKSKPFLTELDKDNAESFIQENELDNKCF